MQVLNTNIILPQLAHIQFHNQMNKQRLNPIGLILQGISVMILILLHKLSMTEKCSKCVYNKDVFAFVLFLKITTNDGVA